MKMNKQQKEYAAAKALVMVIEDKIANIEAAYIKEHNIVNADGSTPKMVCGIIDDEDAFNTANEEVSDIIDSQGLSKDLAEAKETLRIAEDALIDFGLSTIPSAIRSEKLDKFIRTNYTQRQKFLDITFKMDVSSIPKNLKF